MQFVGGYRVGPEADATIEQYKRLHGGKVLGERACPGCFIVKLPHLMGPEGLCTDCDPQHGVRLPEGDKEATA